GVHTDTNCDDGDRCTNDSCDAATGACVNTPVSDYCNCNPCGTGCPPPPPPCNCSDPCGPKCPACACSSACDDDNKCTDDICDSAAGTCTNPAKNCDDGLWCTDDTCDSATGCIHTGKSCDD